MSRPSSDQMQERVESWFADRLPAAWLSGPAEISLDQEEVLVVLPLAASFDPVAFRDETRAKRIQLAQQAEEAFGLTISWGTVKDGRRRLYTTKRTPLTVALGMTERQVIDGLVAAGVAADRNEAVAWCIRLVAHHEADWLQDLRDAVAAAPARRRDEPLAI